MSTGRARALRRAVLCALGGFLALLPPALGQTPQQADSATKESTTKASATKASAANVRILSISTPPLAGKSLPGGGVIPALVNASLARTEPGAPSGSDIRWTAGPVSQHMLNDPAVDLVLPVESADCGRPNDLAQVLAVVCDHAVYSEPILQVVLGLFTLADSTFKFESDDSALGKTLCVSREQDLYALDANGRNWAAYKRVTVLRHATLLDCVVAVQAHDADAFVAIDLTGRYLLARLGLTPYFVMQPRPLATRGVHAVIARGHPRRADVLNALNRGLKRLMAGDAYSAIVQKHVMPTAAPVTAASHRIEAPAPASAPAPPRQAALPDAAPPTQGAQPSLPPEALKPAARPVLGPERRKTALRYLKRGNEELADGRVAPARLLFERAAEMGLAQAAMALAATYDAAELSKPHLRNVLPDQAMARRWYERAHGLGAKGARERLRLLKSAR